MTNVEELFTASCSRISLYFPGKRISSGVFSILSLRELTASCMLGWLICFDRIQLMVNAAIISRT